MKSKYKEIFKLKEMLEKADIPFEFFDRTKDGGKFGQEFYRNCHWEFYQIVYPSEGRDRYMDAVESFGSYGQEDDKLEIMGGLTEEESEHDSVVGWLSAEDVFNRIKKHWEENKKMKKLIRKVNEDTLEIETVEVEDDTKSAETDTSIKEASELETALGCDATDFCKKYDAYKTAEAEFNAIYEPFKEKLIELHSNDTNDHAIAKTIIIGNAKVTYVSPSTRSAIDSKKLKEEEPEIAKKYMKITPVKACIRLENN